LIRQLQTPSNKTSADEPSEPMAAQVFGPTTSGIRRNSPPRDAWLRPPRWRRRRNEVNRFHDQLRSCSAKRRANASCAEQLVGHGGADNGPRWARATVQPDHELRAASLAGDLRSGVVRRASERESADDRGRLPVRLAQRQSILKSIVVSILTTSVSRVATT
jgi:hypothetical protein